MNNKQRKSAHKRQDNGRDLPDRQASREFEKSHQCQSQQCRTRRGLFIARSRARETVDCRRGRRRGRSSPELKKSPKFVGEFGLGCDSRFRTELSPTSPRAGADPPARKKNKRAAENALSREYFELNRFYERAGERYVCLVCEDNGIPHPRGRISAQVQHRAYRNDREDARESRESFDFASRFIRRACTANLRHANILKRASFLICDRSLEFTTLPVPIYQRAMDIRNIRRPRSLNDHVIIRRERISPSCQIYFKSPKASRPRVFPRFR